MLSARHQVPRSLGLSVAVLLIILIGLGAFLISRPFGDFVFLATSVALAVLAAIAIRQRAILASAGLAAALAAAFLLTNAAAALYIRGAVLGLTDPSSLSALNGVVYVLIVLPLVILAALLASVLAFVRRTKKAE